jgi:3'-phosphoadenosine 5'-phosphosulfate sulfotransferase (PAPS reductase)/FAD synthetase
MVRSSMISSAKSHIKRHVQKFTIYWHIFSSYGSACFVSMYVFMKVVHDLHIIFVSENTVYAGHLKKLSGNEKEYKYFDLPSLGPGYGKYKCVCLHILIMSNLKA